MDVKLAGFNVDTNVLREMEEKTGPRNDLTPEVLSASYARISRDPRSISEIRKSSREEVEKARRSNSTIIFKMGHHSVAEHAVFNLDIEGLSRYATEELEKFRLCSYTEKSQRYITLEDDYVIPPEIKGTEFEREFVELIETENEFYHKLYSSLREYVFKKNPELAKDSKNEGMLEGWAKEDARYIVSISTESQIGVTVNARNLELMLRRFASHSLQEIKELGRKIYKEVESVAPSIILFHEGNDYDRDTYSNLKELGIKLFNGSHVSFLFPAVSLVSFTEEADMTIVAALLFRGLGLSITDIYQFVEDLDDYELELVLETAWKDAQLYDSMLREFEFVNLVYELLLSSSAFAQLKRHRMSSIIAQPYDSHRGIVIPESIKEIGMERDFRRVTEKVDPFFEKVYEELPLVAPYVLTNSHIRRVLMQVNARELYHMSRMREDSHAQWEIRKIVAEMCALAKEQMPLTFKLLCGKDRYNEVYKSVFGKEPRVKDVKLPVMRRIKG